MATTDTPAFLLPLTITPTGDLALVDQDDTRDIVQRVAVLCATRRGAVDGQPGEGLTDQSQRTGGPDLGEIQQQIATYIPEALDTIEDDPAVLNAGLARVGVKVAPA